RSALGRGPPAALHSERVQVARREDADTIPNSHPLAPVRGRKRFRSSCTAGGASAHRLALRAAAEVPGWESAPARTASTPLTRFRRGGQGARALRLHCGGTAIWPPV